MNTSFQTHLTNFIFEEEGETPSLFEKKSRTVVEEIQIAGQRLPTGLRPDRVVDDSSREKIPKFINEFWTSKQRQAHSLHEVSYRACFKPQLPRFFIERLTKEGDVVYDPFSGRGTTILEAALLGRNIVANDINPLSKILSQPRLFVPTIDEISEQLENIQYTQKKKLDIDLSMFYHKKTLDEINSLRSYLHKNGEDEVNSWIRMVATNRLTGHSKGFFSVYTLPPNQATSQESQRKINIKRKQKPEYRDTKQIILGKSRQLLKDVTDKERTALKGTAEKASFLTEDARNAKKIPSDSVQLTVTSPPFLDVVQYHQDNWLRCWFNGIDAKKIGKNITMSKTIEEWCAVMQDVFVELFRITKKDGYVAFEVGEVRNGKIALDEFVVGLGLKAGFICEGIMINTQVFTKTANIWGISNNAKGTNTNRIVIFRKTS